MPYVKTINEDGVVSDIMAKAIDPDLLINGFTQTTPGVNALDAAAGKTLNDAFTNYANVQIATLAELDALHASMENNMVRVGYIAAAVTQSLTGTYAVNTNAFGIFRRADIYIDYFISVPTKEAYQGRYNTSNGTVLSVKKYFDASADTVTVSTLESEFKPYNDRAVNYPMLYKRNGVVTMSALLSPKEDIATGTGTHTMFTIPEGYRPLAVYYAIQQGSSNNVWHMTVNTNGTVTFARYRTGDTEKIATVGSWLPFSGTWVTNG